MNKSEVKPRCEFYIGSDLIIIDAEMMPIISKFTWHIKPDKKTKYVCTSAKIGGRNTSISMHRLLTGLSNSQIDHINRNGLDNRLINLRFATNKENSYNRERKNSLGFRGVYKHKNNFAFQIQKDGKRYGGYGFLSAEDAAKAYDLKNKELHGEFGIRNFKD